MRQYITLILFSILFASCSVIMEEPGTDCPGYDDGSDKITLSFQFQTVDGMPRSRFDASHEEIESEYQAFEDGIDMKDCAMFVFAKMTDAAADVEEKLLFKNTNFGSNTTEDNYIEGAPGLYTVNFVISKGELNELLDFELTPAATEKISLRVLLLANCSSPGTNAQAKWNQITGKTYKDVINQLSEWTYAMSYIYNNNYTGSDAVGMYSNNKKNAPMFGTICVPVTQEALYYSRFDNRVYLGEMEMLRAIAKVRVTDNIKNKDIDGYPKILGAEFIGSQTAAKQLPKDALSYVNGNQVHDPNIAEPNKELTITRAATYKLGSIPDSWVVTPTGGTSGPTLIGYVPEQKIDNINGDVNQGMPVIRLNIALRKNALGVEETKQYDVPMTGYNGQTFDFGNSILRNHIYTLSVDEVAVGTEVDLTFVVKEWTENPFVLDYTETLLVKPLEWLSGYESIDSNNDMVVIQPWTTSEDGAPTWVPLTARFELQSPLGADWTASLISLDGVPNTFQFLENGIIKTTVTGTIDGKTQSSLTIVSLDNEPTGSVNSAKLQIIVNVGNGASIMEAFITPSGKSNWTIVQNPK